MPSLSKACNPRNESRAPTEFDLCCLHSPSESADMMSGKFILFALKIKTGTALYSEKKKIQKLKIKLK